MCRRQAGSPWMSSYHSSGRTASSIARRSSAAVGGSANQKRKGRVVAAETVTAREPSWGSWAPMTRAPERPRP